MSDRPGRTEYAIRRLNWRAAHYGIVRMPGATALGALPTFEEAEADRLRREEEARARVANPFICGPTHAARSRLPEPIFEDWLRDVGIEPRQRGQQQPVNWVGWWEQTHKRFSTEQIAHVWAGLDRLQFFEVVARPEGSVGYAVVCVEWQYNDNWMEPGDEGGSPLKVFRRWAGAEAFRREQEDVMRQERAVAPDDESAMLFEMTRWADDAHWPLGAAQPPGRRYDNPTLVRAEVATFYEVVEVELSPLNSERARG